MAIFHWLIVSLMLTGCHVFTNSVDDVQLKCGIPKAEVDFNTFTYFKPFNEEGKPLEKSDITVVEMDGSPGGSISSKGCISVVRLQAEWLRIVTSTHEAFYQNIASHKQGIFEIRTNSFRDQSPIKPICRSSETLTINTLTERMIILQGAVNGRNLNTSFDLIPENRSFNRFNLKLKPQQFGLAEQMPSIPEGIYQVEASLGLENKDKFPIAETPCFLNVDRTAPEVTLSIPGDDLNTRPNDSLSLASSENAKLFFRISRDALKKNCGCGDPDPGCGWTEYKVPLIFKEPGSFFLNYCALDSTENPSKVYSKNVLVDDENPRLQVRWIGESRASSIPRIETYPMNEYSAMIEVEDNSGKVKTECKVAIRDLKGQDMRMAPVCVSKECTNQSLINYLPCAGSLDFKILSSENESDAYAVTLNVRATDSAGNTTEDAVSKINKRYLGEFFELGKTIPGRVDANIVGEFAGRTWVVSDAGIYSLDGNSVENNSPSATQSDALYRWTSKFGIMTASRKSEAWIADGSLNWVSLQSSKDTSHSIGIVALSKNNVAFATESEILVYTTVMNGSPAPRPNKILLSASDLKSNGEGFLIRDTQGKVCWIPASSIQCQEVDGISADSIYEFKNKLYVLTTERLLKEIVISSSGKADPRSLTPAAGTINKIYFYEDQGFYALSDDLKIYQIQNERLVLHSTIAEKAAKVIQVSPTGEVWIQNQDGKILESSGKTILDPGKKTLNSFSFDRFGRVWIYFNVPGRLLGNLALIRDGKLIEYPEYNYNEIVSLSNDVWVKSSSGLYRRSNFDYVSLDLDRSKTGKLMTENTSGLWLFGEGEATGVTGRGVIHTSLDGLSPSNIKRSGEFSFVYGNTNAAALLSGKNVEAVVPPSNPKNCDFVGGILWCEDSFYRDSKWIKARVQEDCQWLGSSQRLVYFRCREFILALDGDGSEQHRSNIGNSFQKFFPVRSLIQSSDFWFGGIRTDGSVVLGNMRAAQLKYYSVSDLGFDSGQVLIRELTGGTYVQDGKSLFKIEGSEFKKVLGYRQSLASPIPGTDIPSVSLKQDNYSRLLIEGDDDAININVARKWEKISLLNKESLLRPSEDDWFEGRSVGVSPSGIIWLWSQEKIAYWDEKIWQVFPGKSLPLDTYVDPSILFDQLGRVWIPNRLEEAFSVFDPRDSSLNMVRFSPSILTEYSIYEDAVGNLWEFSETGTKAIHIELSKP